MANVFAHPAPKLSQNNVPYSRPGSPGAHHQIGWVGLGGMGRPMARNLANYNATHHHGFPPLLLWNRSREKAESLATELGETKARVAQTLAEIAIQCDVVICSLGTDAAVKSVYEEFAAALRANPPTKNKTFVETSTVYPSVAGELDTLISSIPHCHLVTSPVCGPPAMAEVAKLILLMSGEYRCKKEVAHLLVPAVGRRILDLGGNLEKAPTFKLVANSTILGMLEVLAEAFTMAEKTGVGRDLLLELLKELLPAPLIQNYGNKMLHDQFDGSIGFDINGGIKDASHIRHLTQDTNTPMPTTDIAYQHMLTARALHDAQLAKGGATFESLDWSALVAATRVAAGLDGLDTSKHMGVVKED